MVHIKYQIVSSFIYGKRLPNFYLYAIENNLNISIVDPLAIEIERLNAQKNLIIYGGYKGKANNLLLACGMYIWDLEHIHGIPHTITEAYLANDTKNRKSVQQKLDSLKLEERAYNPCENIEKIKQELTRLKCDMSRTALHRTYSLFCKKIDNCLKHALWQE